MKILHLSDLHRYYFKTLSTKTQDDWLRIKLPIINPDVVVITGDIFESVSPREGKFNPYQILNDLFNGITVICTFGNHEFFYQTISDVIGQYEDLYDPGKYNVHYLDIVKSMKIDNKVFFGNVLWYDGSMATDKDQVLDDFAGGTWKDNTIINFDWKYENEKCVNSIMDVKSKIKADEIPILCTHTVPHVKLNGHIVEEFPCSNPYNAFSGMTDFLSKVKPEFALCGHTHVRRLDTINDCHCSNCGNDFNLPPLFSELTIS